MIRIAVISDSHGSLPRSVTEQVQDCSHILHAGDVVSACDLDELSLYGNLYAVRGNCDTWNEGVRDLAGFLRFRIGGVSFYMLHDCRYAPRDLQGIDAVVFGHTHFYSEEWKDGRLWLNPGSCARPRNGDPATMAKITILEGKITEVRKIILEDERN